MRWRLPALAVLSFAAIGSERPWAQPAPTLPESISVHGFTSRFEGERAPAPIFTRPEVEGWIRALGNADRQESSAGSNDVPEPPGRADLDRRDAVAPAQDPGELTRAETAEPAQGAPLKEPVSTGSVERGRPLKGGLAVWYQMGTRTASGERYDPDGLTAGHRTLPFGTRVRVVNKRNGKSVIVRINDRGPVQDKFVIDVSRGTARALGLTGVAEVAMYVLD